MPVRLGPTELTIILVIAILLFGPGRIGKIVGEIGTAIRSFRDGMNNEKSEQNEKDSTE